VFFGRHAAPSVFVSLFHPHRRDGHDALFGFTNVALEACFALGLRGMMIRILCEPYRCHFPLAAFLWTAPKRHRDLIDFFLRIHS